MPKANRNLKKVAHPSSDKYPFSVYLGAKEAEAIKAISLAQDISLSSVIVNLVQESLSDEKYQTAIKAYRNFKNSLK